MWRLGKVLLRGASIGSSIPARIVVRGVNWVGDTIMTLPAAKVLRRMFPSAHIAFWVPSGLEPLIRLTSIPDEIISFNTDDGGALKRSLSMKERLEKGHFDLAVLFQNAFESAFTAWMAGIKLRVGFTTDLRGPLINAKIRLHHSILRRHQVYYYLEIVKHIDMLFNLNRYPVSKEPDCSLRLNPQELEASRRMLLEEGINPSNPIVCLCPGSVNSEAKRWPVEYFAELADFIIGKVGSNIVFLGAIQEEGLINDIMRQMKRDQAFNLAAKSNIVSSLGIMSLSRLVISNDTGSAHLAAAAGSRVLTIFGPTVAGETAPFSSKAFIVQGKVSCAPCRKHVCNTPGHPCMRNITPSMVGNKALEIMAFPET